MKTYFGYKPNELPPIRGYKYITTGTKLQVKDAAGNVYVVECDPAKGAVLTPVPKKARKA